MTNLSKLELGMSTNPFWFILLILCFAGFAYFVYRWTNPPVGNRLRYLLIGFRIFSLALILFILFEPNLSLTWFRFEKPVIAVLADNSASMQLTDKSGDRAAQVKKVLANPVLDDLKNKNDLKIYKFSSGLEEWNNFPKDSLNFDGDGTDIQTALEQLLEINADNYLKGIVLVTDGADNLGENPSRYTETIGIPVFPVAIGDADEPRDVLITKVFTNQITYVNNKVPLEVTVKSAGYTDNKIQVILKEDGKIIETKNLRLGDAALEQKVEFQIIPESEGIKRYQIEIPALEGEITRLNNNKETYIKVLKNKMKLLVVNGTPSTDFAFLKRTLERDKNIELSSFTEKKNGTFYEGAFPVASKLKKFDAIVFLNYPRRNSENDVLGRLLNTIDKENKPLLIFSGPNIDFSRLNPLRGQLPINLPVPQSDERNIHVALTPEGALHPVLRLDDDPAENAQLWTDLPPVFYPFLNVKMNPTGKALAEIDRSRSGLPTSLPMQPVFAVAQVASRKTAVILAHGLWRWQFLLEGLGKEDLVYSPFFNKLIRWLVTREENKRVRIQLEKDIFRGGEPITFKAQVYDENYRPVDDAEVKVNLKNKNDEQDLLLSAQGNGKYETTLQVLAGGDYIFTGSATRLSQTVGSDSGRFSVEPFNIEFQQTKMEEALLRRIASSSNGQYFTPANFNELSQYIDFPPKRNIETREWELWNKILLMLVLILSLSIEWFIRKRKGML